MPKKKPTVDMDRIIIYLPLDLKEQAVRQAYQLGLSASAWLLQLLKKEMSQIDQDNHKLSLSLPQTPSPSQS